MIINNNIEQNIQNISNITYQIKSCYIKHKILVSSTTTNCGLPVWAFVFSFKETRKLQVTKYVNLSISNYLCRILAIQSSSEDQSSNIRDIKDTSKYPLSISKVDRPILQLVKGQRVRRDEAFRLRERRLKARFVRRSKNSSDHEDPAARLE